MTQRERQVLQLIESDPLISQQDIAKKLGELGYSLTFDGDNLHIVVPTWRSTGDVSIKADIMEECRRCSGGWR